MNETPRPLRRIAIVGAGAVGATLAYALMIRGQADELVWIDINRAMAEGEAMDLRHGLPFVRPVDVHVGDYADCADADIVVHWVNPPKHLSC